MDDLVHYALRRLSFEIPVLVLYATGMVASIIYRKRIPGGWRYSLAATSILFVVTVGAPFLDWLRWDSTFQFVEKKSKASQMLLAIASMSLPFVRAVAIGLLLVAVFRRGENPALACSREETNRSDRTLCLTAVVPAFLVYLVSLFSPAVFVGGFEAGSGRPFSGFECLTMFPFDYPAWWANPVFFVGLGCLILRRAVPAGICGVIATLLTLSYLVPEKVGNETDEWALIAPVEFGYWIWVTAMGMLALSLVIPMARTSGQRN